MQSSTGKLYLFGTVHLLRDGTPWRSPELDAAIKASQDLYLEIADPANTGGAMTSLVKIGFDRDHPLSTKVSKSDVELLNEAAKRYGFGSEAAFEPMQPWLAFIVISAMPALHSGYAASNGVDVQIRKDFVDAGKPVRGFETFDMQAHIFADMPQATQVALLEDELKSIDQSPNAANVDSIVNAWLSGNEDRLAASMQLDKLGNGAIYTKLLTDRNEAWASALAERLKQPGTSFVSVGAGHLLGANGLPALLARMGYTVRRVQVAASALQEGPQATPSPAPTATASATPIPQTLTPPPGWKTHGVSLAAGAFKADRMWVAPDRDGVVMAGHLDVPGISATDLDSLDALLQQGMAGAGVKVTQQPTRVKICNGKQDGLYSKLAVASVKEDIVLTVSDRGYLAQYVRRKDAVDDPAATRSILSLCAP